MKRTIVLAVIALTVLSASAFAASASGTLAVSATINPSVTFVFQTDASGVALGSSGTSAATLNFGTVQAFGGTVPTNVTLSNTPATNNFSVSTPVGFLVNAGNTTSANNYTLKAQLATADAVNTWTVGGSPTLNNTTAQTVTATGAYGTTATSLPVKIVIPYSNTTGAISNTINFTVTTN